MPGTMLATEGNSIWWQNRRVGVAGGDRWGWGQIIMSRAKTFGLVLREMESHSPAYTRGYNLVFPTCIHLPHSCASDCAAPTTCMPPTHPLVLLSLNSSGFQRHCSPVIGWTCSCRTRLPLWWHLSHCMEMSYVSCLQSDAQLHV